jgi:tellurite resistance protein TehA-like permease
MSIGASLFLIAVGAILAFAVTGDIQGLEIEIVGWILLGTGVFGLVLSLVLQARRRREAYVVNDPYEPPPRY